MSCDGPAPLFVREAVAAPSGYDLCMFGTMSGWNRTGECVDVKYVPLHISLNDELHITSLHAGPYVERSVK